MAYECKNCGFDPGKKQSRLHEHHVVPKEFGGGDSDGRILLCGNNHGNKCHKKIHIIIRKKFPIHFICSEKEKEIFKKLTKEWLDDNGCTKTIEKRGV